MLHFAPLSGPPTFPGHARCAVTTDLRGEWREERGERREERGGRRKEREGKDGGEAARLQIDLVNFNRESTGRGSVFVLLFCVSCMLFVFVCVFSEVFVFFVFCVVFFCFRGGPDPRPVD